MKGPNNRCRERQLKENKIFDEENKKNHTENSICHIC